VVEEKDRLPREPDQGFVGRLVPDPSSPPELTLLVGYPGGSVEKGHVRLYASPDLSRWWEIPEDDVLHRQAVPNDPLGAEIVWIRRDKQPVLNSRRSDSDMNTFTFMGCPTLGCTAAAAVPPAQPAPLTLHCSLLCPTSPWVCPPSVGCPPHTGAQLGAAGPVQHQPHTIMGFNCPTGPVQTPPAQNWGTTPVGAAAPHPTFFGTCTVPPVTMGCTYGGAQGHLPPHTMITVVVPPHTHEAQAQAQPQQTWVWPTQGVQCMTGTTPVAQGAQAPQQTYVLPTLGQYPTIPPATICCYR
jgi:hypothetical protein